MSSRLGLLHLDNALSSPALEDRVVPGRSEAFHRVLEQIELVADRDTTVLLMGETGSGKEVAAREIHRRSGRGGALVSVNCAGVPSHLLEAEFFGHEKGAFTDAAQARPGLFERADGGTLLLDEIGEMPLELQPKLLRALQEGEVARLGGGRPRKVNVRLIAATNRDLWEQVRDGAFREDLFYRINVFPVHLPPLRERPEDIPDLLAHFVRLFCERDGLERKRIAPQAIESLRRRHWPGNVRELRNAVELAVIRSQNAASLELEHFPAPRKPPAAATSMHGPIESADRTSSVDLYRLVAQFERDLIQQSLAQTNGNKSRAAEALGIKRTTLVEKLKRFERDGLLAAL